ncbi:MAG: hypothetical protein NVS2B17_01600 [Candidatus Velthaea sp.]
MILRSAISGVVIATSVESAKSFFQRTIGLLGRSHVQPDEGLWIEGCSAIHTIGMRAAIDVVFLDAEHRVLRTFQNVRPNVLALRAPKARHVVELGSGALATRDVQPGDRLELVPA